jgi:hypothetical protein
MMPQISGRPGITCIQKSGKKAHAATTLGCRTFEDMGLLVVDILNQWKRPEKDINRCVPVLLKASWHAYQLMNIILSSSIGSHT